MARIFITGSSDGLGQIAARALIAQGHAVTIHARNTQRAEQAMKSVPGAAGVLIGDLSSISQTKALAAEANKGGAFDVVMHNAGLGFQRPYIKTEDGLASEFAVNTLAPYTLTCLMKKPKRLVYLSSGMHTGGDPSLTDVAWKERGGRGWSGPQAYSDTKLQDIMLAFAVARHWPDVESNACTPGWVKTKMGGSSAPGNATEGASTQIYLAGTQDKLGTGRFWAGMRVGNPHGEAQNVEKQEQLLKICEDFTGVAFPREGHVVLAKSQRSSPASCWSAPSIE